LKGFGNKGGQVMEVPPTAQSRRFNECDIIGNLDRDDKGNVVVGQAQEGKKGKDGKGTTKYFDKDGKPTNGEAT